MCNEAVCVWCRHWQEERLITDRFALGRAGGADRRWRVVRSSSLWCRGSAGNDHNVGSRFVCPLFSLFFFTFHGVQSLSVLCFLCSFLLFMVYSLCQSFVLFYFSWCTVFVSPLLSFLLFMVYIVFVCPLLSFSLFYSSWCTYFVSALCSLFTLHGVQILCMSFAIFFILHGVQILCLPFAIFFCFSLCGVEILCPLLSFSVFYYLWCTNLS